MSAKIIRTKTKYTNIYYNEHTKKYDVKYNYKIYNTTTQKNQYKQKWIYNLPTITEAKKQLVDLQTQGTTTPSTEVTLSEIYKLWEKQAEATKKSVITIRNTRQQFNIITQHLPQETKLKNITEDVYYECFNQIRQQGYSEETIHSLNACFRKLMNLAYKKKLILENPLHRSENIRTTRKSSDSYRILTHEEFRKLDAFLQKNKFYRLGNQRYEEFRLLFNLLYYSGLRIGEALALTYNDFIPFTYYQDKETSTLNPLPHSTRNYEPIHALQIKVNKSYVSDMKLLKEPKNKKNRIVPLPSDFEQLFMIHKNAHLQNGGSPTDRVFICGYGTYRAILANACQNAQINYISPHGFRHTYISNLISKNLPLPVIEKVSGDTQETILKTYSHLFEKDILQVLTAIQNL